MSVFTHAPLRSLRRAISLLVIGLAMMVLFLVSACQPPASGSTDTTDNPAPAPATAPAFVFDGVRGQCAGEVDFVAWGFPIRIELQVDGEHADGSAASGSVIATSQLGAFECGIESGKATDCIVGAGRVPFIPSPPPVEEQPLEESFDVEGGEQQ